MSFIEDEIRKDEKLDILDICSNVPPLASIEANIPRITTGANLDTIALQVKRNRPGDIMVVQK